MRHVNCLGVAESWSVRVIVSPCRILTPPKLEGLPGPRAFKGRNGAAVRRGQSPEPERYLRSVMSVSGHRVLASVRWLLSRSVVGLAVIVASPTTGTHLLSAAQPGPMLILEDSVVLRETDDHYIGQPISLIRAEDGSFLVADGFSNSVLHFDSRGRFQRVFGRKGRGPGEFRFVSSAGFVAGDLVGFGDDHAFELELFELGSGKHIGAAKMSPSTLVDDYAVRGDTLWFAGINTESWKSVGLAALDDLVDAASSGGGDGSVLASTLVVVPRPYAENEEVMGLLGKVSLDVHERGLVGGFAASPYVLSTSHSGVVQDTASIPGDGSVLASTLVVVPRPYAENEEVMGLLGKVSLDVHERGLVGGFAASPYVLSTSHSGVVQDTASIPVARRRGLPEEHRSPGERVRSRGPPDAGDILCVEHEREWRATLP